MGSEGNKKEKKNEPDKGLAAIFQLYEFFLASPCLLCSWFNLYWYHFLVHTKQ